MWMEIKAVRGTKAFRKGTMGRLGNWLDVGPVGWVLPKMSNVWGFWSGWLMPLTEIGFVYFLPPSILSLVHSLLFLICDIWHVSYHSDSQVWVSSGILPSDTQAKFGVGLVYIQLRILIAQNWMSEWDEKVLQHFFWEQKLEIQRKLENT